jgi:hypothetical protein
MKKFTTLPLTLYRVQSRLPVKLRSFDQQILLNRTSFDLKLHNDLVLPIDPSKGFKTPNGMSLRPPSETMIRILKEFKGSPTVYTLRCGLELPEDLCVYHEHTDHYSLQTTVPISLPDFNKKLTEFLESLPVQTREQFLEMAEDVDDQDN